MKSFVIQVIALLLSWNAALFADKLPQNHSDNGGLAIIPIDIKNKPEAFYQNHKLPVLPSKAAKNQWLLITAIPLDNEKAVQNIEITAPQKGVVPFHISDKYYRVQSLVINNKRKVDPYAKDRPRIEAEQKRLTTLYQAYTDTNPFADGFIAPIHGPITSLFGLKRIYNGKPRAPHSGLDIGAPSGVPVKVTAAGTVVDVYPYFFTGNTVVVDHGMGVLSLYAHLSKMNVKTGDTVKQGQVVGLIGKTGRVTGPHLHWMMVMNQTLVDPLLFTPARVIRKMPKKKIKTVKRGV